MSITANTTWNVRTLLDVWPDLFEKPSPLHYVSMNKLALKPTTMSHLILRYFQVIIFCVVSFVPLLAQKQDTTNQTIHRGFIGKPFNSVMLVQAGYSYRQAARKDIEMHLVSLSLQPLPYLSGGFIFGRANPTELVKFSAGPALVKGYTGKIHLPIDTYFDLYAEYEQIALASPLSFTVERFALVDRHDELPFRHAETASAKLTTSVQSIRLGIRVFVLRCVFVDVFTGFQNELFRLSTDKTLRTRPSLPLGEATAGALPSFQIKKVLEENVDHRHTRGSFGVTIGVGL